MGNRNIVDTNYNKTSAFIKYMAKLALDAIIIIDIIIPFLYFNFSLSAQELLGCAVVFFVVFLLFSAAYWPKFIKERRG